MTGLDNVQLVSELFKNNPFLSFSGNECDNTSTERMFSLYQINLY